MTAPPQRGLWGIIEGFYGAPWTPDARLDVLGRCAERGMRSYVYAPKDDPLHRERWREPYDSTALSGFAELVERSGLAIGFAISPGLSMDPGSGDDRSALAAKVDSVLATGIAAVVLCLDDIPVRPGAGGEHAELTAWLANHVDGRAEVALIPTEYTGTTSTAYLDALAEGVPDHVPIGWTGRTVVCDTVTVEEARARAASLGGRRPLLWDNYPVNDALLADRLHLGPLRGRPVELLGELSGYLANPMIQPYASLPALLSICGWLRGEDPETAWRRELGELAVFAEACDGAHPAALVDAVVATFGSSDGAGALDELEMWLRAARRCEAPGIDDDVAPWLEQVRAEAAVGRSAVRLLRAIAPGVAGPDRASALEQAMALALTWPALRRSEVSVLGIRCGFRPVLAQHADGSWAYRAESLVEDRNVIDQLVRFALARLAELDVTDPNPS